MLTHSVPLVYAPARGNAAQREMRGLVERALEQRDGPGCFYCSGGNTTIDHVVSVASGGTDEIDNLVLCCLDCNWKKSSAPAWFFTFKRELGVAR